MTVKSETDPTLHRLNRLESRGFIAVANLERQLGRRASSALTDAVVHQGLTGQSGDDRGTFSVVLSGPGADRSALVRAVREITGLDLKQAQGLIGSLPTTIVSGLSRSNAEEIIKQLRDIGAQVEVI